MIPPVNAGSFLSTHRLIPSKYSPHGTVLADLGDDEDEVADIVELDGSTNARLSGEAGLLPGIGVHELVFGVPNGQVINASFTHAAKDGGRFNNSMRGAWYAGIEQETSMHEVAYHRIREMQEVGWQEEEVSTYDDYLADFIGDFHDLRGESEAFKKILKPLPIPQCYADSQLLATSLLDQGSNGIVFPSVRHTEGTCLVCFRPALVYHVRRSHRLEFRLLARRPFTVSQVRVLELPTSYLGGIEIIICT